LQAVEWAKEKNWKDLEDYCMKDTMLTHHISIRGIVHMPLTGWNRQITCIHSTASGGFLPKKNKSSESEEGGITAGAPTMAMCFTASAVDL
jgi:hypothetical protein